MKSRLYIAALGAAALLGGCGNDNEAFTPTPAPAPAPVATTVPDSAGASASAFITFLTGLAATENTEPLELGTFDPTPTLSDTTEPIELNAS